MSNCETWNSFLTNNAVDNAKVEPKKIQGKGRSYYLIIGPEDIRPYKDAKAQHKAQTKVSRRTPTFNSLREVLKQTINAHIEVTRDCNVGQQQSEQAENSVVEEETMTANEVHDQDSNNNDTSNNRVDITQIISNIKSFTDSQLQHVMYKMMQEQHSRNPEKKRKSVFTMSHNSGDMGGVAVE
jgi:recombination DNA repair RAD52 pathway protein